MKFNKCVGSDIHVVETTVVEDMTQTGSLTLVAELTVDNYVWNTMGR